MSRGCSNARPLDGGDADGEAPHAIYNIGNHEAVELETFIATLEQLLGRKAIRDYQPMQAGDVPATYASIDRLRAATGFAPRTPLAAGPRALRRLVSGLLSGLRAPTARPRCGGKIGAKTSVSAARAFARPRLAKLPT